MGGEQLPSRVLAVLEAMTRPDPGSPLDFDSPAAAISRRLPRISTAKAVEALYTLKVLGLINIAHVSGTTTSRATENLKQWITPEGWTVLGMQFGEGGPRPS